MHAATGLVCSALLLGACAGTGDPSDHDAGEDAVVVAGVVDGDTVDVERPDGTTDRVRLIGINAPESDECFAREAAEELRALVDGAAVELVADTTDRDRYDRLLRYVEVDGSDVGETLIESGHAIARRYPPDTMRADAYERAQEAPEQARIGLWAPSACGRATPFAGTLTFGAVRFDADGPDAQNLNDEWVRIDNSGDEAVDLTGWVVRDESASNRYAFPDGFELDAGASVTLRTGCGADDADDLHWCRSGAAVWNNDGDTAFLLDPSGNIVSSTSG